MCQSDREAPSNAFGFVKNAELPQDSSPVIIDSLADEAVIVVERENGTQRELNTPPGRRKPAPRTAVRSANDRLKDDLLLGCVAPAHGNLQVRHRPQEIIVEGVHSIVASVVRVPRFVVRTAPSPRTSS